MLCRESLATSRGAATGIPPPPKVGPAKFALIDACAFDDYAPCDQEGFEEQDAPGADYRPTCSTAYAEPTAFAGGDDTAVVRCISPSTGLAYSFCGVYKEGSCHIGVGGTDLLTYEEAYAFCEDFEGDPCR